MRKVVYGAACSLDGFIAGVDGSVDWLLWSKDVTGIMQEYWGRSDALVMGRKTWEVGEAMGGSGGDGGMSGMRSYVFSRTLPSINRPGVELVSSDAGAFVRDLKKQKGKDIIVFGGGNFASSLFAAGVIDEVGLNVHPILLGAGIPMFRDPGQRVTLELTRCRQLAKGCVLVDYRVKHGRRAAKH